MNRLTNFLGVLIIVAASLSVFTHDRSWLEVAAVIPSASILLFVQNKDAMEAIKSIKE